MAYAPPGAMGICKSFPLDSGMAWAVDLQLASVSISAVGDGIVKLQKRPLRASLCV